METTNTCIIITTWLLTKNHLTIFKLTFSCRRNDQNRNLKKKFNRKFEKKKMTKGRLHGTAMILCSIVIYIDIYILAIFTDAHTDAHTDTDNLGKSDEASTLDWMFTFSLKNYRRTNALNNQFWRYHPFFVRFRYQIARSRQLVKFDWRHFYRSNFFSSYYLIFSVCLLRVFI
jgi:hypothetical protein